MANRRRLVKSNKLHQNVVVLASASAAAKPNSTATTTTTKARFLNHNNLTIIDKNFRNRTTLTIFITLTVISCLVINSCLSFAYKSVDLEQQWPDSSSVYWELGKGNANKNIDYDIVSKALKNYAPSPSSQPFSQFSRVDTNKIIINDDNPLSTYYITSEPKLESTLKQEPSRDYIISQQINGGNSRRFGDNVNNDHYYYPVITNSAPFSSNDKNNNNNNNNNNDDDSNNQVVDFNSKLLNLLDYPIRSHSHSRSPPSFDNVNNIYENKLDYDNNNYYISQLNDKSLDDLNQQDYLFDGRNNLRSTSLDDKSKDLYKLVERNDNDNNNKISNKPRKLVTLLEDESDEGDQNEGGIKRPIRESAQKEVATSTTSAPDEISTTSASYGTVLTGKDRKTSEIDTTQQSASSVFNRMYKKLSNYLPFLSQINILKGTGNSADDDNKINNKSTIESTRDHADKKTLAEEKNRFISLNNNKKKNNPDSKNEDDENNQMNTKQSVSKSIENHSLNNDDNTQQQQEEKEEEEENNKKENEYISRDRDDYNVVRNPKDEQTNKKQSALSSGSSSTGSSSSSVYSLTSSANENDINKDSLHNDNKNSLSTRKLAENSMNKFENDDNDNGRAKVSLLRQSGVVMPLEANDELVSEEQQQGHSSGQKKSNPLMEEESLIGKYVNSGSSMGKSTTVKKLDNEGKQQQLYHSKVLSHKAFSSRRQAMPTNNQAELDSEQDLNSDDSIVSYGRLFPTTGYASFDVPTNYYTHHRVIDNPMGIIQQNKTNDIYFLIMVGAFCAMAVAVVLAAGLFVYRVQQNRKSTNESDYPTYGVVGPNNMMGGNGIGAGGLKCGGANAIVGSYFNSNLNSSNAGALTGSIGNVGGILSNSSPMGSKLGSAKHLPDLYSLSDSGFTTTTTGSSKSSSTKKISSSSDNNNGKEQQHNRSNYMANQDAARMYHYQHQKQQMIISDRASAGRHTSASDLDSEDENDEGSYTVYECPGLASAHEMEIKNPLFNDDE